MKRTLAYAILAATLMGAPAAEAHRGWLLPSAVQVEGNAPWVTVDAAMSETLFLFDSFPLRYDTATLTGPDGKVTVLDHPVVGHLRTTFDIQLPQPGTYRITAASAAVMGSYTLNGETKRFRGSESDVPAGAADIKVMRMNSRFDTFVTAGKGNDAALQPTGKGLEMVPVTHPSDLVTDAPGQFRFLLDGKPLAGLKVAVVPGGARYRNALKDVAATTDSDGRITVQWPMAGQYLITASYPPRAAEGEGEKGGDQPARRDAYSATVDVLPN
ncbi:DUF4198 domain-containing protein [Asticcacaulis solisilvae]|uniref:DUF4198 domain-containing protein n=1 Tax=Asticcacaulis solisilvae TaxID=1217274 RepID=UPI003FD6D7EF